MFKVYKCYNFLLFQAVCKAADHVTENNDLYQKPEKGTPLGGASATKAMGSAPLSTRSFYRL